MFGILFEKKEERVHNSFFERLIRKEYSQLRKGRHTYLDFTGGGLPSKSQLNAHSKLLKNRVLGNPHSVNPTSQVATLLVEETREKILKFFKAKDYFCVFTANASGALKIVGESYPFDHLLLLADNHNSVNGLREFAKEKYQYAPVKTEDLEIDGHALSKVLKAQPNLENKVFAYPAQSNVSGVLHDLKWVDIAQKNGWDVVLDAAAYVPSNKLDLSIYKPNFVSISFYKMFGYPTGIGCLLVRKDSFEKLNKPWFAGGTVRLAAVNSCHHYLANNHERFEDGTLAYSQIPAIKIGLEFLEKIGMVRLKERVNDISGLMYSELQKLTHSNGTPMVKLFGPENRNNCGGNFIFNLLDPNGNRYALESIEHAASKAGISLRTGCFCNPGIDEINNEISTPELEKYFTGRTSGDYYDMVSELNKMRGAIRVSIGIASSERDVRTFFRFIQRYKDFPVATHLKDHSVTV